jgi:hypothetical protein
MPRKLAALAAAFLMAMLVSGCVVVPAGPYYHPHHYWGY